MTELAKIFVEEQLRWQQYEVEALLKGESALMTVYPVLGALRLLEFTSKPK